MSLKFHSACSATTSSDSSFPDQSKLSQTRGFRMIRSMFELEYINHVNNDLIFTSSGIQYMMRSHKEHIEVLKMTGIVVPEFQEFVYFANKYGLSNTNCHVLRFQLENSPFH